MIPNQNLNEFFPTSNIVDHNFSVEYREDKWTSSQQIGIEKLIKENKNICILGPAGTGKSTIAKSIIDRNESVIAAAPTGIAAVNIEGITINSLLGFYNTASLRVNIRNGKVLRSLRNLRSKGIKTILIDEISMLSAEVLDLIIFALCQDPVQKIDPINFILIGDPGQLPPISGDPFFNATSFNSSNFNTIKLNKIYRQENPKFIEVLNKIRIGKIKEVSDYFVNNNLLHSSLDTNFKGVTILSTNKLVDAFNKEKMDAIEGKEFYYSREVKGEVPSDWKKTIPEYVGLKKGCRVMALKNNSTESYVNGDTGIITELFSEGVALLKDRDQKECFVGYVNLKNYSKEKGQKHCENGNLKYLPIRCAYGITLHKSQGQTVSHLQVDVRHSFMGRLSGGLYTGLSRCKSSDNLRCVGNINALIRACSIEEIYIPYLK